MNAEDLKTDIKYMRNIQFLYDLDCCSETEEQSPYKEELISFIPKLLDLAELAVELKLIKENQNSLSTINNA